MVRQSIRLSIFNPVHFLSILRQYKSLIRITKLFEHNLIFAILHPFPYISYIRRVILVTSSTHASWTLIVHWVSEEPADVTAGVKLMQTRRASQSIKGYPFVHP